MSNTPKSLGAILGSSSGNNSPYNGYYGTVNNTQKKSVAAQSAPWTLAGNEQQSIMYHTNVDVLALSCARLRLGGTHSLSNAALNDSLTADDVLVAKDIRKYYERKIIMWQLHSKDLTNFRKALAEFLVRDGTNYKDSESGLIYKLPEFYFYDQQIDKLVEEHYTGAFKPVERRSTKNRLTLVPLKLLNRSARGSKISQYWFKNTDDKLVVAKIMANNPLKPIWDTIFDAHIPLAVEGVIQWSSRGGFDHYVVENWHLANNVKVE